MPPLANKHEWQKKIEIENKVSNLIFSHCCLARFVMSHKMPPDWKTLSHFGSPLTDCKKFLNSMYADRMSCHVQFGRCRLQPEMTGKEQSRVVTVNSKMIGAPLQFMWRRHTPLPHPPTRPDPTRPNPLTAARPPNPSSGLHSVISEQQMGRGLFHPP